MAGHGRRLIGRLRELGDQSIAGAQSSTIAAAGPEAHRTGRPPVRPMASGNGSRIRNGQNGPALRPEHRPTTVAIASRIIVSS